MLIVPSVAPVPLSEAYPETTEEEKRNPLAWLFRRFPDLFSKGRGTEDSYSIGKGSTNNPYEWINDDFPGIFKEKKNIEFRRKDLSTSMLLVLVRRERVHITRRGIYFMITLKLRRLKSWHSSFSLLLS